MNAIPTLACIATSFFVCATATGQEINLSVELNKMLFNGKSRVRYWPEPPNSDPSEAWCDTNGNFNTTEFQSSYNSLCVVTYRNVRVVPVRIDYSEVKKSALPDAIVAEEYSYKNCSPNPLTITDEKTFTTTEGYSISATTTVSEGSSVGSDVGLTIPIYATQLGITEKNTVSFKKDTATDNKQNFVAAKMVKQQLSFQVDPETERTVRMEKRITTDYLEFDGVVTLDADVHIPVRRSDGQLGEPQHADYRLSSFTPKVEDRTLHLKGQIWNVKGEKIERSDRVRTKNDAPDLCQGNAALFFRVNP